MAHSKGPLGQRLAEARASIYEDAPAASSDDILRTLLEQAYHGAGMSPAGKIHAILQGAHPEFAHLVRELSTHLLQVLKLRELDKVIMNSNIQPSDGARWVPNTRRLAENTMQHGVAPEMETVALRVNKDVRAEVLSVLGPFIAERQRLAEQERQQQALAAQLLQGGITIGPGMPVPIGPPLTPQAQPTTRRLPAPPQGQLPFKGVIGQP